MWGGQKEQKPSWPRLMMGAWSRLDHMEEPRGRAWVVFRSGTQRQHLKRWEQATNLEFFRVQLRVPRQIWPDLDPWRQLQERMIPWPRETAGLCIEGDPKDRKPAVGKQRKARSYMVKKNPQQVRNRGWWKKWFRVRCEWWEFVSGPHGPGPCACSGHGFAG